MDIVRLESIHMKHKLIIIIIIKIKKQIIIIINNLMESINHIIHRNQMANAKLTQIVNQRNVRY